MTSTPIFLFDTGGKLRWHPANEKPEGAWPAPPAIQVLGNLILDFDRERILDSKAGEIIATRMMETLKSEAAAIA